MHIRRKTIASSTTADVDDIYKDIFNHDCKNDGMKNKEKSRCKVDDIDCNLMQTVKKSGMNDPDKKNCTVQVPSFIRLFVIRRIILNYIYNIKSFDYRLIKAKIRESFPQFVNIPEAIQDLVHNVFNHDVKQESAVCVILTRLIHHGPKVYMSKWYNEKHANVIEIMFDELVLKKFDKQYDQMMTYIHNTNRNNHNYYQNCVFNLSDLVCSIFQYLEWGHKFDKDLFSCSLVNSSWLYYSWNVNSVYHMELEELIKATANLSKKKKNKKGKKCTSNNNNNNNVIRMWQRLIHTKSIHMCIFEASKIEESDVLLNKLSSLTNIETIKVEVLFNDRAPVIIEIHNNDRALNKVIIQAIKSGMNPSKARKLNHTSQMCN